MPRAGPAARTAAELDGIAKGQNRRTVLKDTDKIYLSKMNVMGNIINSSDFRGEALQLMSDGGPAKMHIGDALNIPQLILPMNEKNAMRLFAAIATDTSLPRNKKRNRDAAEEQDNIADGDEVMDPSNPSERLQTVTAQTYQNYKSALKWWHEHDDERRDKVGSPWPSNVDSRIQQQIKSYKRDVGIKKRQGIMKQKEGKCGYNLTGYIEICKYFNLMSPKGHEKTYMEGIFAQLFIKLSVNTFGRSDNIDDIMLRSLDWENDALTISFANTKSDIEGATTSEKKRLFANPFMPEICVILGLAVYTWSKYFPPGALHLFDGKDQNKRFYRELMSALDTIDSSIDFGCQREDIGTHSSRKFGESSSVSKVDGPSRTQVCLRAGQSVGRTQDCYMKAEDDGDSLVGRTVAQLKFTADQFDVLTPHFSLETLEQLNAYGWNNILEGYDNLSPSYKRCVPFLFANLVYHHQANNLSSMLATDHQKNYYYYKVSLYVANIETP